MEKKIQVTRLQENFYYCPCGAKLTKRNRFAILIHPPLSIDTKKREMDEKYKSWSDLAIYTCEKCATKAENKIIEMFNTGFFMDYNWHRSDYKRRMPQWVQDKHAK